jgi:hypothetical protein
MKDELVFLVLATCFFVSVHHDALCMAGGFY